MALNSATTPVKMINIMDDPCPSCAPYNLQASPNGATTVDATMSVLAHELTETATDPELSGWRGNYGEDADMCAWQFGDVYEENGYQYDTEILSGYNDNKDYPNCFSPLPQLGNDCPSKKFLLQMNWDLKSRSCKINGSIAI